MNLEWAKNWLESSFIRGLDEVMLHYADDVTFEDSVFGEKRQGKAALREFFAAFFDPRSGHQAFTVLSYRGDATGGVVEWLWEGEHAGDLLGVPAAGKKTTTLGVSVFTFADGLVTSQHDLWNARAVLQQLGAIPG